MQIQIKIDHDMNGNAPLSASLDSVIARSLGRCSQHIANLSVHFSDPHAEQVGGHYKRCLIDAEVSGRKRLIVTHEAASLEQAATGAAQLLARAVGRTFDRLRAQQRQMAHELQHQ